jgi:DMSO/TMAO reductase YedYZ molybdopterin-dependent catalytic subunit
MSRLITRRQWIRGGLSTVAGATGIGGALYLGGRHGLIPPDHQGLFGVGETLTYAAQRLLVSQQALAREFDPSEISRVPEVNGPPPLEDAYLRLLANDFSDWRLRVDGLVARPGSFSLQDIQRMPAHDQITLHVCEEGWSFIAQWTGVRLSYLLDLVGISPRARYVVFRPYDGWWGSLDMADALHDQTFLAYGMNGRDLPTDHGAPLRLRVARQLGYASIKYLAGITVTDSLDDFGLGLGSAAPEIGYSWYGGI